MKSTSYSAPSTPHSLNDSAVNTSLAGKRIVILGLARQGVALARFAAAQGAEVVVSDLDSAENLAPALAQLATFNIDYVLGSHPSSLLDKTDFLAISGSVPADAAFVNAARTRGIDITNDSQEFLRRSPAPVIGITGSAGKSTTTTLTGAIGRANGTTTWVGGNIGQPLIDKLHQIQPHDLVIQELSSFQLEIWQHCPAIAAVLNITPNHLDRHKTMDVYAAAKANILHHQTCHDIAIFPATGLDYLKPYVQGRLRQFSMDQPVEDGAFVRAGQVVLRDGAMETVICDLKEIRLRGQHNILNVLAAVVLADSARFLTTPINITPQAMRQAIQTFTGISHRLELVKTQNGVQYINDSIATAPERAIAAINAFDEPLVLLTGGRDKDLDWDDWAQLVTQKVKTVILFGELAPMVSDKLDHTAVTVHQAETLTTAIHLAHDIAAFGDVVLLSPGGTSFDAFKDFAQRGDLFKTVVNQL